MEINAALVDVHKIYCCQATPVIFKVSQIMHKAVNTNKSSSFSEKTENKLKLSISFIVNYD